MSNEFYTFLKAVSLITLSITAFSFGVLIFAFIDKFLPDPLEFYRTFSPRGFTAALAALIVAFPLYLFLMRVLGKSESKNKNLQHSKVGKWLTYIILVVVAAIIIGDFIAVLTSLLNGELTLRFILKALTILLIAGSIFGYYLWALQREEKPMALKIFSGAVVAIVALAVVYGLSLVGTPAQQRLIQFDERRVSDLQTISYALDSYWERNERLPETLEELREPRYFVNSITDPKTNEPYEYRQLEDSRYELCAVFETDSSAIEGPRPVAKPFSEQIWTHGVGHSCFELEVYKLNQPL